MNSCLLYTSTGSGSEAGRAGRGKALPDRSRTQQIRGSLKPAPDVYKRQVHKSSNYYEALGIISEYVKTELSDHREQPRTPRKETLKKEDTCR